MVVGPELCSGDMKRKAGDPSPDRSPRRRFLNRRSGHRTRDVAEHAVDLGADLGYGDDGGDGDQGSDQDELSTFWAFIHMSALLRRLS